jgi:sulfite exporter TauE/SafE
MLSSLMLTAFLMGLAGIPHCAAMCGAACAAFLPGGVPLSSLLGRCLGYALLGGVAAASFGTAAQWGRQFSFVQPLWMLVQALVLVLGLSLLLSGRMPRQFDAFGQGLYQALRARVNASSLLAFDGRLRWAWPVVAGMAWALLPCGLLYAAVMVAALAPDARGGALVMLAFALPGSLGLWGAPVILRRLASFGRPQSRANGPAATYVQGASAFVPVLWLKAERHSVGASGQSPACAEFSAMDAPQTVPLVDPRWAVRLSGLMLVAMSAWALYHQLMDQWKAWCA